MTPVRDLALWVVTGKGGVGRTTTAAALAHAAAGLGLRVCAIELSGQSALAEALGADAATYAPQAVHPGLWVASLSPVACVGDFGSRKLRLGALGRWLFESRLMAGFLDAVPGLNDVVQLGKVENLLREPLPGDQVFDLVVLDAPATGHGITLLQAARAMGEMTRVGPFHDLAEIIRRFLADDAATGTVVVTLPESLPVHEALELTATLREDGTAARVVVVNQVVPTLPDGVTPDTVRAALATVDGDGAADRALAAVAGRALARIERQRAALTALDEALSPGVPRVHLPRVDGPDRVARLAAPLAAWLEGA